MNAPDWRTVGLVVTTAGGYAALALVADGLPLLRPGPLSLVASLTLPLALLFGAAVGWGVAAGIVVTALARGSLAPETLVAVLAVLAVATLGPRLWGALPRLATGTLPTVLTDRGVVEYLTIAVVTSAAAAATLGWGYELLAASPFHLVAVPTFLALAAGTTVVGVPVLALGARVGDRLPGRSLPTPRVPSRAPLLGALLAPVWLLAGVVASLGFRVGQTLAPGTFTTRGLDVLLVLLDPSLVGWGGRRVQVLLGAVALVLGAFLVTRPAAGAAVTPESAAGPESESESATRRGVTDR